MAEKQTPLLPKHSEEDELGQEFRDLISTLPMDKGWFVSNIHRYQGFWHSPQQLKGLLSCQKHFQAKDTDVLLATHPKSGTTWLKALTFSLLNRKRYPIIQNQNQNHPLSTSNPHTLVPLLEIDHLYHVKEFAPNLNSSSSPRLLSTHLPYVSLPNSVKDSASKIVYLCRDPKDTFISLWHFTNKLSQQSKGTNSSLEESFDMFCRGVSPSGPFWVHILGYWSESLKRKEKIMFLRFEEMKMKPALVLKELAEFVGCPFSREEEAQGVVDNILKLCSFDNLSNLEVNTNGRMHFGIESKLFFRRGQVGDWKNYLTVEMIEKLNTITEKELAEHGIQF